MNSEKIPKNVLKKMKIKKIKGKYYVEEEELRLSDVVVAYLCFLLAIVSIGMGILNLNFLFLFIAPFFLILGIYFLIPELKLSEKKLVELDKHLKEEEDCDSK